MVRLVFVLSLSVVGCGKDLAGPTGPTGPAGASGASMIDSFSCVHYDSDLWLYFKYSSNLFSDGTRFVSCEITAAATQASHSEFYSKDDGRTSSGECSVTWDLDYATFGTWVFSLYPKQAQYKDDGNSPNGTSSPSSYAGKTESFLSSECGS